MEKDEKQNKNFWRIAAIIFSVVFIVSVILIFLISGGCRNVKDIAEKPATTTETATENVLPDNPVDFEALEEENGEIYAWIKIPGTKVDYPVLQSAEDDNYYLHRNIHEEYEFGGCLFTQCLNSLDFTDPVTVIYGHNMKDNSYFGTLQYFRDPDFFKENDYFYIYTPGHILTYKIFAAYEYDNRHILNSFDFANEDVRQKYFDDCLNPVALVKNVRDGIKLDINSKIVTLSTCVPSLNSNQRYLVQGVLVKDENTK